MLGTHVYGPLRPRLVRLDFAYAGGHLYAGPFKYAGQTGGHVYKVNLAQELKYPADIVVPTVDFGVPPEGLFKHALLQAAKHLASGGSVYAGCGFGIGRTGTFVAALCKLNREVLWLTRRAKNLGDDAMTDPVAEARSVYLPSAVETDAQQAFVRDLDVAGIARRVAFRMQPSILFDKRWWNSLVSGL